MAPTNGLSAATTITTSKAASSTRDSSSPTNPTSTASQRAHLPSNSVFSFKAPPYPASSSALTSSTASPSTTTTTLPSSMSTPSSPLKQRRVSLAYVDSSAPLTAPHRSGLAWSFRDDTGIESHVAETDCLVPERRGKLRKIMLNGLEDSRVLSDGLGLTGDSFGSMATALSIQPQIIQHPPISVLPEKKQRKKWSAEETQMLVEGCNRHGVGNWKAILSDPDLKFDNRSPVDLKDRFRTYFPDAYKQHYPNARTHLSSKIRSTLPDGSSLFEKTRSKKRRPFTKEEDEALRAGYEKHGTVWAAIVKDPIFQEQNRRSTDLRDRFRNAFPELYQAAGYKPRNSSKKKALEGVSGTGVSASTATSLLGGTPASVTTVNPGSLGLMSSAALSMRHFMTGRAATDDQLSLSTTGPVRSRRRAHTTSQGLGALRGGTKSVPQSNAGSEDEYSSGEEDDSRDLTFKLPGNPASAFVFKSPNSTITASATSRERKRQSLPIFQHHQEQQQSTPPFQQQPVMGVPFTNEPSSVFIDDEMELVTLDDTDPLLNSDSLMMGADDTDDSPTGQQPAWSLLSQSSVSASTSDAATASSVSTTAPPAAPSTSGLDTPTHLNTPHTQHSQWPSAPSTTAHISTSSFQQKRSNSCGSNPQNTTTNAASNNKNSTRNGHNNASPTDSTVPPSSVPSSKKTASTNLGNVDLDVNLGSPVLGSSTVPGTSTTTGTGAPTVTATTGTTTNTTGNGNNNIGKSPWATQDWLSSNPRLGIDASSGSGAPSGSASSPSFFDSNSGSGGVISGVGANASGTSGNGSGSGGGSGYVSGYLSPVSSPFSMSNHSLSYGVMERYDLFPTSSQLMNDWDIDWMSEVGYGDSHSTFSDDSFPISSSASVSTGMGIPPASIAGVFASGGGSAASVGPGLGMGGVGGAGIVGGGAGGMYGYGTGIGLGRGFTHHSNYAGDLIFSTRTHQPVHQGFYGSGLGEGLGLSFPSQSGSTSAQQKQGQSAPNSTAPAGATGVSADSNAVTSSAASVASSNSPADEQDLQHQQQTPQSVKSSGSGLPLQLHHTPMLPGIDEIELTGISLADDEDDAMDVLDVPMSIEQEGANAGGLGLFLTSPPQSQPVTGGDVDVDLDVDLNVGVVGGVVEMNDMSTTGVEGVDPKQVAAVNGVPTTPNASSVQKGSSGVISLSRETSADSRRRHARSRTDHLPATSPVVRTSHSRSHSQHPPQTHSSIGTTERFSLDDLVAYPPTNDALSPPSTPVTRPRGANVLANHGHQQQNMYPNPNSQHGRSISVPPSEARSAYAPGGVGSGVGGSTGTYGYTQHQQQQQIQHSQHNIPYSSTQTTVAPNELYDLPFLDLHYYGHGHPSNAVTTTSSGTDSQNGSTTLGMMSQGLSSHSAGVLGSTAFHAQPQQQQQHHTAHQHHHTHHHSHHSQQLHQHHQSALQHELHLASRQGQALDLAGTSSISNPSSTAGLKGIDGVVGGMLGGLNLHTLQLVSPMATAPTTTTRSKSGSALIGGSGSFHYHQTQTQNRGQNVVCPQDLMLRSASDGNKRKRASWDGGHP
ncbi:hypothetical protein AX16_003407 [Volvariella volvacea WC 439]|nr:hypothetical protein AX16_003407 [Volvariella volvacea WC 439]